MSKRPVGTPVAEQFKGLSRKTDPVEFGEKVLATLGKEIVTMKEMQRVAVANKTAIPAIIRTNCKVERGLWKVPTDADREIPASPLKLNKPRASAAPVVEVPRLIRGPGGRFMRNPAYKGK